jgi:RNA polymerase sigma factor (sigma-70 family)
MNGQSTVHVVDDDAQFLKSVTRLLRLAGFVVEQYDDASQLLKQLTDGARGCILLDLDMPRVNGLQLQARLLESNCTLPIIFLTGRGDISSSVKAMKSGAEDFLCKPINRKDLCAAIERALQRSQIICDDRETRRALHARMDKLTSRERQVFHMVIARKFNKQIAHELNISERTVKAHRQRVMRKLEIKSTIELISVAERWNVKEYGSSQKSSCGPLAIPKIGKPPALQTIER